MPVARLFAKPSKRGNEVLSKVLPLWKLGNPRCSLIGMIFYDSSCLGSTIFIRTKGAGRVVITTGVINLASPREGQEVQLAGQKGHKQKQERSDHLPLLNVPWGLCWFKSWSPHHPRFFNDLGLFDWFVDVKRGVGGSTTRSSMRRTCIVPTSGNWRLHAD